MSKKELIEVGQIYSVDSELFHKESDVDIDPVKTETKTANSGGETTPPCGECSRLGNDCRYSSMRKGSNYCRFFNENEESS